MSKFSSINETYGYKIISEELEQAITQNDVQKVIELAKKGQDLNEVLEIPYRDEESGNLNYWDMPIACLVNSKEMSQAFVNYGLIITPEILLQTKNKEVLRNFLRQPKDKFEISYFAWVNFMPKNKKLFDLLVAKNIPVSDLHNEDFIKWNIIGPYAEPLDDKFVKMMIKQGLDITSISPNDFTALDKQNMKVLLDNGYDVNKISERKGYSTPEKTSTLTTLLAGIVKGDVRGKLEFLLENGLDLKKANPEGYDLLDMASDGQGWTAIPLLIKNGVKATPPKERKDEVFFGENSWVLNNHFRKENDYLDLVLLYASYGKNIERAKEALDMGANINCGASSYHKTPLSSCAGSKLCSPEMADFLIKNGADMYYDGDKKSDHKSGVMYQCFTKEDIFTCQETEKQVAFMEVLVKNGYDLNHQFDRYVRHPKIRNDRHSYEYEYVKTEPTDLIKELTKMKRPTEVLLAAIASGDFSAKNPAPDFAPKRERKRRLNNHER